MSVRYENVTPYVTRIQTKTGVNLLYQGEEFQFRKEFSSKKLGRNFLVYYCVQCRKYHCSVSIREEKSDPVKYYVSIREHDHTTRRTPQHREKKKSVGNNMLASQIPKPKQLPKKTKKVKKSPPIPSNGSAKSKKRRYDDSHVKQNRIHIVYPGRGSVNGGDIVSVFFSVSRVSSFGTSVEFGRNCIGSVKFGYCPAEINGAVHRVDLETLKMEEIEKFVDNETYQKCSSAQFILLVKTPPSDHEGYVNVYMDIFNSNIHLEKGFEYFDISSISRSLESEIPNIMYNDDDYIVGFKQNFDFTPNVNDSDVRSD